MTSWIVVILLYLLGMGLFHVLGGLSACGEALRRWGEAVSTRSASTRRAGASSGSR